MSPFRHLFICLFTLFVCSQFSNSQTSVNIFPGAGSTHARTVKQTPDGGYIAMGSAHYNWNSPSVIDEYDALLIKMNANFEFESQFVFSSNFQESIDDAVVLQNGDIILLYSGNYPNTFSGQKGIIKIDAAGNVIWFKNFDYDSFYYQLELNSNNELILLSRENGAPSVVLTKLDTDGNVIWSKSYSTNTPLSGAMLNKGVNDEFFLTMHQTENSQLSPVIARLNDNGSLSNIITIAPPVNKSVYIRDIYLANNLDYYVLGDCNDDSGQITQVLFKLSNSGNLLWSRELGFQHLLQYSSRIDGLGNANVIVTGTVYDTVINNTLPNDGYALAYNASGNLLWANRYDGNEESFNHVFANPNFVAIVGTLSHHSNGQDNIVTLKMDETGYIDCPFFTVSPLTLDLGNNGCQISPIVVSVSPNSFANPPLSTWGFTTSFQGTSVPNCESVGIETRPDVAPSSLFPNPSNGSFTISISESSINSKALIYDVTGRQITELELTEKETNFELSLEEGAYYIHLEKETIKMIVK